MKKIEIITKNHGKKKSQVIKVKKKSDLAAILTAVNFSVVKDNFHDIDLTGEVRFKVDGKKKSVREVRDIIKEELRSSTDKDSKSAEIKRDKDGRIVIGSRHSDKIKGVVGSKNKKKNKELKKVLKNKKQKTKKNVKDKKKKKKK